MASWIDRHAEKYIEMLAYPDSVAFIVGAVEAVDEQVVVTLDRRQVRIMHLALGKWLKVDDNENL